jgi:intein-encoded DNA endonuclease-like protein
MAKAIIKALVKKDKVFIKKAKDNIKIIINKALIYKLYKKTISAKGYIILSL